MLSMDELLLIWNNTLEKMPQLKLDPVDVVPEADIVERYPVGANRELMGALFMFVYNTLQVYDLRVYNWLEEQKAV